MVPETARLLTALLAFGSQGMRAPLVALTAAAPLRWVTPQRLAPGVEAPRGDLLLWTEHHRRFPVVRAVQDGRVLARRRLPWPAAPGRVFRVPAALVVSASPAGGPVVLDLDEGAAGAERP
jgi:hypothetical protein